MLIWINGTYGVGKTTLANELAKHLGNVCVLDSDYHFIQYLNTGNNFLRGGGCYPQNNERFLRYFKSEIIKCLEMYETIIIAMSITMIESKISLYDYFESRIKANTHFILTMEEVALVDRIQKDENREDKELALKSHKNNIIFLKNNFENAVWVDITGKSLNQECGEIIEIIGRS